MMVECAAYGLIAGMMMRLLRTKSTIADLYISMIAAMLMGRVLAGLGKALVFTPGTAVIAWVVSSLITGIPGILIQLLVMPAVILALTRAHLIPRRYSKEDER
jgi:hypothetical protein